MLKKRGHKPGTSQLENEIFNQLEWAQGALFKEYAGPENQAMTLMVRKAGGMLNAHCGGSRSYTRFNSEGTV